MAAKKHRKRKAQNFISLFASFAPSCGQPKLSHILRLFAANQILAARDVKKLAADLFRHNIRHPMPENDLRDAIKEMMVENLMLKVPKEEIRDDMPLFGPDSLGLDSIDALELVVSLEKRFGVSVPNSETARTALATVNSMHDYVAAHRKPAA
jgi:acyl carrier protein